jgi:hypothetical protein
MRAAFVAGGGVANRPIAQMINVLQVVIMSDGPKIGFGAHTAGVRQGRQDLSVAGEYRFVQISACGDQPRRRGAWAYSDGASHEQQQQLRCPQCGASRGVQRRDRAVFVFRRTWVASAKARSISSAMALRAALESPVAMAS